MFRLCKHRHSTLGLETISVQSKIFRFRNSVINVQARETWRLTTCTSICHGTQHGNNNYKPWHESIERLCFQKSITPEAEADVQFMLLPWHITRKVGQPGYK